MTADLPQQGEIWWAEANDKHRPVLVVTRSECVASFDNLQPVRHSALTSRIGSLGPARRQLLCRALGSLADC